jgi:uncharacterized membrane protein YkoI
METHCRKILAVAAAFAFVAAASMANAAGSSSAADLLAEAKVTEAQATATALAKVPQGKVKSAELERENGKLVWSFDIAQPRVSGVMEIQVDAMSGAIVSVKKETRAEEAREAKSEAREAGAGK